MKKFLAILMSAIMLLSMASFASAEEPFVITVMLPDFYADVEYQKDDNPVLKAIEEKAGVKLNITWVANSAYKDQTSVIMADPDNMPMIMVMQGPRDAITVNSAKAGAFWDLTDHIDQFENLAAGSDSIYSNVSVDGRIYGIYRSRATARAGIYYRTDIAEKVGITEKPKTIEDLTKLAMALASYSDDTYALNMCKYVGGTIGLITVAYGAPYTWGVDANGDIYPAHKDPAFLEGLNWLRDLYAAGGIDPDFMTIESGNWDNIERQSKAFMRFDCMDNAYRQQEWFEKNEKETGMTITNEIFAMLPFVENAKGETRMYPQNAGYSGEVVITKSAKTEEDMLKCLKFLDWCNSAEGQTLINWGIDGTTYWIREDGYRYTNPTDDVDMSDQVKRIQKSLNQLGMNVNGDLTPKAATTPLRTEYNNYQNTHVQYVIFDPCHALTSETYIAMGSTLSTALEDAHVQYIAGLIDADELAILWEQWEAEGGAQMTKEYNDAYHAANAK